jgi:hypothetical protein
MQQSNSNESSIWNTYPCIVFPRILFGSLESKSEEIYSKVPPGLDPLSFSTMRFRFHQLPKNITVPGKSFVDVSRYHGTRVRNPHNVLGPACYAPSIFNGHAPAFPNFIDSVLRLHHYIGLLDIFLRGNSSRGEHTYNARNSCVSKNDTDDSIRGWLQVFVDQVGKRKAFEMTQQLRQLAIENFAKVYEQKELGNFTYPFYRPPVVLPTYDVNRTA